MAIMMMMMGGFLFLCRGRGCGEQSGIDTSSCSEDVLIHPLASVKMNDRSQTSGPSHQDRSVPQDGTAEQAVTKHHRRRRRVLDQLRILIGRKVCFHS